jgi:glycosyltransferase involved in cell wall biosynthesis
MLVESLSRRPVAWLRWQTSAAPNFAAVVQDPSEIFPEVPDWKRERPHAAHLRRFRRLAVTSNEMRDVLTGLGYPVVKVNTRSLLPLRDRATIVSEGLRVFTRAQIYPRKDLARFEALRRRFAGSVERFDPILGGAVMEEADYVRQIDAYNCYVCTSWQEGGPLTLMDAQRRGCVALTTRVGQTDELIEHGVNGFFCAREEEFSQRLQELRDRPLLLQEMRHRTLERAADGRDARVREQLRAFLP